MSRKKSNAVRQLQNEQFPFENKMPINAGHAYDSLNNDLERYYFNHYFYMLLSYAINMFEWKNLPNDIPDKFIEYNLCTIGYGAFSKAMMNEPIFTRCTLIGPWNMYWEPENVTLYTQNGFNRTVKADQCVITYNNYLRQPTADWLATYARRMAQAEAFIQVNFNSCKTPVIIKAANANQRLTLENAYAKYTGNCPVIIDIDNMGLSDQFEAINLGVPFLVPDANAYKRQTWDEAMLFLGIQNVSTEKRERMITQEAQGNMQQIEISRSVMLNARKDACAMANEKFGWNMDVDFRILTMYSDNVFGTQLTEDEIREVDVNGNNNDANGFGGNL